MPGAPPPFPAGRDVGRVLGVGQGAIESPTGVVRQPNREAGIAGAAARPLMANVAASGPTRESGLVTEAHALRRARCVCQVVCCYRRMLSVWPCSAGPAGRPPPPGIAMRSGQCNQQRNPPPPPPWLALQGTARARIGASARRAHPQDAGSRRPPETGWCALAGRAEAAWAHLSNAWRPQTVLRRWHAVRQSSTSRSTNCRTIAARSFACMTRSSGSSRRYVKLEHPRRAQGTSSRG